MVIDDFHFVGVPVAPGEAYPPLVVDTDGMPPGAIALQFFQPIARHPPDFRQIGHRMNRQKLAQGAPLNVAGKPAAGNALEEISRFARSEALDHT